MDTSTASAAVFRFDSDHNMLLTLGSKVVQQGCHTRPRLDSERGRCILSAPSTAATDVEMTSSCKRSTTVKVVACQMPDASHPQPEAGFAHFPFKHCCPSGQHTPLHTVLVLSQQTGADAVPMHFC
jgi:hypothetical protein